MQKYDFNTQLAKIFDFSAIRAQKILETIQFTGVYMTLGVFIGVFIEKMFAKETTKTLEQMSALKLYSLFFLRITLNVIFIFYINKIGDLIPFMFRITDNYISGYKVGGLVVLPFLLFNTQPSFVGMIVEIAKRLT